MQLRITHKTSYSYSAPVSYALQKLRLRPLTMALQDVTDWSMQIDGGKIETQYRDHYGNHVDLVSITPGVTSLSVEVGGTVTTRDTAGVLGKVYTRAPLWHFREPTVQTMPGPAITELAGIIAAEQNTLAGLHALSAAILEAAPYKIGATQSSTSAEDALTGASGVCQDHAQIFAAAVRVAGIPARYVSGYLMMNETVEQDASHAWAEAYVEGLGWVGFDISNGYCPDARYVRIAVGRDARDASPVEGLRMGSGAETLSVTLQVQQ